ncbi:hypothetical protein ACIQWS_06900 [Phyllobacterium sp. NPDC097923]|uniref:hypothetical protein n=1 Tax=Phyllobacterium sp. NPDC097923 TaxID=3364404 RepID=UPI00383B3DA9
MSNRSTQLVDASNLLIELKNLVEVLCMAASDIHDERQQCAIQCICDIADERIAAINAALDDVRQEPV